MSTPPSRLPVSSPTKRTTASPITASEDIELAPLQNGHAEVSLPLEEDIMQCARIGALKHIQDMYSSGRYDASYKDGEGITPLHVGVITLQARLNRR
jgi:palmitoyltransferase ZDHHC13/17